MDRDTAEVPEGPLVDHIVATALEVGEYELTPQSPPGAPEPEWSIDDVDDWDVDPDGGKIKLHGETVAEYSVKVAPATRIQPPEYETRTMDVRVEVVAHWDEDGGLGGCTVRAERW